MLVVGQVDVFDKQICVEWLLRLRKRLHPIIKGVIIIIINPDFDSSEVLHEYSMQLAARTTTKLT